MVASDQEKLVLPGTGRAVGGVREPATHTPGPWHIKPGDASGFKTRSGGSGIYANARSTDDFFILQIASMETNLKGREVEANARLIAAAPDLLEALTILATQCVADFGEPGEGDADDEAVGGGESGDMAVTFGAIRKALSAIAKAVS